MVSPKPTSETIVDICKTVAANAPIVHGLWRHAFLHVRKRSFSIDVCTPLPEYNLNVRAATDATVPERDNMRGSRGSRGSRVTKNLRKSVSVVPFGSETILTEMIPADSKHQ